MVLLVENIEIRCTSQGKNWKGILIIQLRLPMEDVGEVALQKQFPLLLLYIFTLHAEGGEGMGTGGGETFNAIPLTVTALL